MPKRRVPLYRTSPVQSVLIDPDATVGAQVGVNLLGPDGKLVSWDRIVNPASDPDDPNGGFAVTIWQLIEEVPPNVTALANTATTGLYVVTDAEAGSSVTREFRGAAGEINIANGSGVGGNPTASLADVSITTGGALKKYGFDTKGRLSQSDDATTTDLTEGTNLYFTVPRAQAAVVVSGITEGDTTHSPSSDAVFDALALKADASDLDAHEADTDNPHEVTAAQVGLGNVDNTSDADKPVSTAQQTALDGKASNGAAQALSNWNSFPSPAFSTVASGAGASNGPGSGSLSYVGLQLPYSSGNPGGQIAALVSSSVSELWFRGISGGSPAPWLQALTAGDLANSGLLTTSPTVANLDTLIGSTARFFRWQSGATGQPINAGGVGIYIPYTSVVGAMIAFTPTANRAFFRGYNGGWSAWKEVTAV